jgi:hypothetical protein
MSEGLLPLREKVPVGRMRGPRSLGSGRNGVWSAQPVSLGLTRPPHPAFGRPLPQGERRCNSRATSDLAIITLRLRPALALALLR